ncbi:MAG TPA: translation elongation factor Ts [Gemmatimonadales bacterium]|nr:translation elongation factor Ts [Gemmatimonadales bacterium]
MASTTISPKQVAELRARTGAGMMDCKKALEEANGDMEKAAELLRARGIAKAEKRAGRSAAQGLIAVETRPNGSAAAMVELDCETDFVARTEDFQNLLKGLVAHVAARMPAGINNQAFEDPQFLEAPYQGQPEKTVAQVVKETSGKTGEAVVARRYAHFAPSNGVVGHYLHHNQQVGVLVELTGAAGDAAVALARDIALHIASADPLAVSASDIPADVIERERRIAEEQVAAEGKPENIRGKIVDGKIKKFVAERTLLEQPFVKDDSKSVGQLIKDAAGSVGGTVSVARFARFKVGEA